jgi:hypothetical protein
MRHYLYTILFALIGLLGVIQGADAQIHVFQVGDLNFSVGSTTTYATVYHLANNSATDIVIPETVEYNGKTYPVTKIRENAFYNLISNNTTITSITIPSSVTEIGESAFYGITNLRSIELPEGITQISDWCFSNSGLTHITIPKNVQKIGRGAFADCRSLNYIVIPSNVKEVAYHAFMDCQNVSSIELAEGLETIGHGAFCGCDPVSSITIPATVKTLADNAFIYDKLSSITVLGHLDKVTKNTFPQTNLETLVINEIDTIGDNAFVDSKDLVSVKINKVKVIGKYAFNYTTKLTEFEFPEGLTTIGDKAFYFSGLTSINLPEGLISVGEAAFEYCPITKVTLPSTLTSVGQSAFMSKTSGGTLYVPVNLSSDIQLSSDNGLLYYSRILSYSTKYQYSTLCSRFDLDFSGDDVKAYVANSYDGNNIELTRITNVSANTPVVVVAKVGKYELPQGSQSSDDITNYLKGSTTATTVEPTADGYTSYILTDGTQGTGFYPISEAGTLTACKAYLSIPTASSAKAFGLNFVDNTATAIKSVATEASANNGVYYTLQGVAVSQPQKGLYIHNGKKIIIK